MSLFHLQTDPLPCLVQKICANAQFPEAGGMVAFEGCVRNHHLGRAVLSLSYSAYVELALSEGESIVREAISKFDLAHAAAAHRYGPLRIGECAVWVAAWGRHRAEAFEGARFLIDEIKRRLPIWKEEFYADGTSEWVHSQH
jgi:molybdopterin synthase catalytic subunit